MGSDHSSRKSRRRKCCFCKQLFTPDPRTSRHQKACSKKDCQAQRKRQSQRAWAAKSQNKDYFRGKAHVERVQQWRKSHPGYWRRGRSPKAQSTLQDAISTQTPDSEELKPRLVETALQDVISAQAPLLLGLISSLTGSTLQDDIARSLHSLIDRGAAILGPDGAGMAMQFNSNPLIQHERKTTHSSSSRTSAPQQMELDRSSLGP